MTLKELEARIAELQTEARALVSKAEADNDGKGRDFTDEEATRSDEIYAELDSLEKRRTNVCKAEALQVQTRKTKPAMPGDAMDPSTMFGEDDDQRPEQREFAVPVGCKSRVYKSDKDAYVAGRFLLNTLVKDPRDVDWDREKRFFAYHNTPLTRVGETRVATEAVNTAGGYLVPDVMSNRLIELRLDFGVFRREATVMTMGSDNLSIPRKTGEVTAYFVDETDAITASDMAWDQVVLNPKKLATLSRISSDLNEDSMVSIADAITRSAAFALAQKEDQCGFIGDGTSTYGGMHGAAIKIIDGNHSASVNQASANENLLSELDLPDFEATVGLLPDYARATAKWYCDPTVYYNAMIALANAAGGNTIETLQRGDMPAGRMFMGYPVVFVNAMSGGTASTDLASLVVALFGDLSLSSTFGDRRGITIARDESRYFENDQIAIKVTERFDIVNHDLGDTSTAGPLCALQMNTA